MITVLIFYGSALQRILICHQIQKNFQKMLICKRLESVLHVSVHCSIFWFSSFLCNFSATGGQSNSLLITLFHFRFHFTVLIICVFASCNCIFYSETRIMYIKTIIQNYCDWLLHQNAHCTRFSFRQMLTGAFIDNL